MVDLFPITLFACITAIIIFIASRRHRERVTLIKQGKTPFMYGPSLGKTGSKSLFLGLVATAIGLALLLSAVLVQNMDRDLVTASLLCLFGGGAMLLYWKLTAQDREYARKMYEERMKEFGERDETQVTPQETPENTENNEAAGAQ